MGLIRKWEVGHKYKTPKGEFIVIRKSSQGYLVEYLSGEWEGKFIDMPKEVGGVSKTMESLRMSKESKEKLLDTFFNMFPDRYSIIDNYLYRMSGKTPRTEAIVEALRSDYPPEFQMALDEFLKKQ